MLLKTAGVKSSTAESSGKFLSHLRGLDFSFSNDGNEQNTQLLVPVSRVQVVAFFHSLKPLIDRNGSKWRSSVDSQYFETSMK